MHDDGLTQFLALTRLLQQFRTVERSVLMSGSDRRENDAEHSFQVALVAWYIADREELDLSREKLLMYALVHDLVEVYAGDVEFYDTTSDARAQKGARERAAIERLGREFPEWGTLHETIETYEARADAESRFIYALDKVVPIANIYLDGGRLWKEEGITLARLETLKREKVQSSETVRGYFEALVERLRTEAPDLFPARVDT